ncbi:TSP1 protein, partial [Polypterus senegalus]|nr:TSP1 protein [Polypterus senegalus]
DPYKAECTRRKIQCHQRAICRLDIVTETFYCQCIPGHNGDGVHFCQEPSAKIIVHQEQSCDGAASQLCVIKCSLGETVRFMVSVVGDHKHYNIQWFKFYSSYGHTFYSYRKRLRNSATVPSKNIQIMKDGFILKLEEIQEDDYFPNLFWVQLDTRNYLEMTEELEPYEISSYDILNPSQTRYYFVLDSQPIDISKVCIGQRSVRHCKCSSGFKGNGLHCVDVDECFRGLSQCNGNATCVNTLGSYACTCPRGYFSRSGECIAKSMWTPWSPWSICSVTCGSQNQMRFRICTHPESGMSCEGPTADLKPCDHLQECPVDGSWSQWSLWSQCPLTCGLAVVSRTRSCSNPTPQNDGKVCPGHNYEEAACGLPVS